MCNTNATGETDLIGAFKICVITFRPIAEVLNN